MITGTHCDQCRNEKQVSIIRRGIFLKARMKNALPNRKSLFHMGDLSYNLQRSSLPAESSPLLLMTTASKTKTDPTKPHYHVIREIFKETRKVGLRWELSLESKRWLVRAREKLHIWVIMGLCTASVSVIPQSQNVGKNLRANPRIWAWLPASAITTKLHEDIVLPKTEYSRISDKNQTPI